MFWPLDGLKKLRRTFSFADKIAAVVAVVGASVFALSIAYAALAYKADKEAYLFELQTLRARSAATELESVLLAQASNAKIIAPAGQLPPAAEVGLLRLPEQSERFVVPSWPEARSKIADDPQMADRLWLILFRSAKGDLMAAPLPPTGAPKEDGTVFAITRSRELLFSGGENGPTASNVAQWPSVKTALESGLTESTLLINSSGQSTVVSYREIPGTNTIAFAEMPTRRLLEPFYLALRIWTIYGIIIVVAGGFFAFFATKNLARPVRIATQYLARLAKGDYSPRPHYGNNDEFLKIFSGIEYLAKNIVNRENRLKHMSFGLRNILVETADWPSDLPFVDLRRACAELTMKIFDVYKPTAVRVLTPQGNEMLLGKASESEAQSAVFGADAHKLEVSVQSRGGTALMQLVVYGVEESKLWPETLQTTRQLCEAISSHFERRSAHSSEMQRVQQANEMAVAARIQKSLVSFPEAIPNVELAHYYIPANQVGGDWTAAFYDDEQKILRIFMGDVTGHGVAPSLVTAMVASSVKTFYRTQKEKQKVGESKTTDEAELMKKLASELNAVVCEVGANSIAMTMFMASLDCDCGQLTACNLGHPLPVALGNEAHAHELAAIGSRSCLGTESFKPPDVAQFVLSAGQGIFVFTDGLIENYDGAIRKRLLLQLGRSSESAKAMLDNVLSAYTQAREDKGEAEADDDVALLALMWKGA